MIKRVEKNSQVLFGLHELQVSLGICRTKVNNTLRIENIRRDELDGRMVDKIIEYGKGYWTQTLDDIIGARPFIHNSFIDLKNGKARDALKRGLIREGLNIK